MLVKKITNEQGQMIIATIDEDLLGKRFEEGKKQLDLTSDFYKGTPVGEEDFKILLTQAYIINAVGEKVIDLLLKEKMISSKNILRVEGIPHVQIVKEN